MRLHRLRLRAIGPFAGEHLVDFEPLTSGGLFLLDGPTGAGKSTLLDAMTFALYGPGERAGDGRLHSHFADPTVRPEVELEFSVRGVRSRVTRTPEFARPKRRGAGVTVEKATVHLERLVGGSWESRSANKAEVGDLIGEELGLTREQFRSVVLLPQGEFMRFLRAADDERRALLTKLFGTQLYDRITDELDRRRQDAARELDRLAEQVRLKLAAAAEAACLDEAERDVLQAADPDECRRRLDLLSETLAEDARAAHEAATAARYDCTVARAELERARARRERCQRFATAVAELRAHAAGSCEIAAARAVAESASRAEPVRPLLMLLEEAEQTLAGRTAELGAAGCREGAGELAARAERMREAAGDLARFRETEDDAARARNRGAELREALRAARDAADELGRRRAEFPRKLRQLDERIRGERAVAAELPGLAAALAAASRRRDAAAELAGLRPELAEAARLRVDAVDRAQRCTAEHLRLLELRLAGMAAELAAALTDGAACPVCGGLEHPAPAATAQSPVGAAQVARAAGDRAAADEARRRAEERHAELDRRVGALAAVAGSDQEVSVADLEREAEVLADRCTAARTAADRLPGSEAERSRVDAAAQQAASDHEVAERRTAELASLATESDRRAAELDDRLVEARSEFASVRERIAHLRGEAAELTERADRVRAVEAAGAAVADARARASQEADRQGFGSLAQARAAALPPQRVAAVRSRVRVWEEEDVRLAGRVADADFADLDPARAAQLAAEAAADVAAAERRCADAEARAADATDAARARRRVVDRFSDCRDALSRARRAAAEAAEQAAPVIRLAQLAKGMAGQRRVALTTYVLRQWFESVVDAANLRLAGMSSGRYQLVRVDEAASRAERAGLTLQVLDHHTGEKRSPRSLSGGETFYTSLALALGLADVVRAEAGGIDLDTLFIDEGFGSLDPDTLEEVMTVIDDLRDRGRTVGIVSHVSELKERIAERVEVRRLPDGSSTLRVVA